MKFKIDSSSCDFGREKYPLGKSFKYAGRMKSRKPKDKDYQHTIELNTMEELLDFIKECGHDCIISHCKGKYAIEVYDDWRE